METEMATQKDEPMAEEVEEDEPMEDEEEAEEEKEEECNEVSSEKNDDAVSIVDESDHDAEADKTGTLKDEKPLIKLEKVPSLKEQKQFQQLVESLHDVDAPEVDILQARCFFFPIGLA